MDILPFTEEEIFLSEIKRRLGSTNDVVEDGAFRSEDALRNGLPVDIVFIRHADHLGPVGQRALLWSENVRPGGAIAGDGFSDPQVRQSLEEHFKLIQRLGDLWVVFLPATLPNKLIHQIWLGDKPLPDWFEGYQRTWHDHFPDWEYRLWTDRDLPELLPEMISTVAFDHQLNVALRSDVLRLELLRRFGGLYVDADYECLDGFAHLLRDGCFSYGDEAKHRPGNALMAAPKNHGFSTFYLQAIARYLEARDCSKPPKLTVQEISGPDALHRALQTWVWDWELTDRIYAEDGDAVARRYRDIVVFDTDTIYPYGFDGRRMDEWRQAASAGTVFETFPRALAVHHWGGTWL